MSGLGDAKKHDNIFAIILVVALLVRIVWIFWMPSVPISDFGWYYDRARSILAGTGFSVNGHPTAQFPPGYPYFLALLLRLTGSLTGVKLAQAIIGTFTCYLIYRLASILAGQRAGLVAGALSAVYPNLVFYNNLLASENLFIPLLLGGFIILLDDGIKLRMPARTTLVGLIFGIAALTRPAILLFPAIFFIWLLTKRMGIFKALGLTALMGVLMFSVILPWTIRNYIAMGSPVFISSNGGEVFWMGNNAKADGGRWYPVGNPVEKIPGEIARSNMAYKMAIADTVAHKQVFARIVLLKFPRLFRPPDGLGWNILDGKDRNWTKENLSTPFFIRPIHGFNRTFPYYRLWLGRLEHTLWVLTGIGALLLVRRGRVLIVLMLYLYWFSFHLIFAFGHPRFVMPLGAFNLALVAVCLVELPGWIKVRAAAWWRSPLWARLISIPAGAAATASIVYAIILAWPHMDTRFKFAPDYLVGIFLTGSMIISAIVITGRLRFSSPQPQPDPQESYSNAPAL